MTQKRKKQVALPPAAVTAPVLAAEPREPTPTTPPADRGPLFWRIVGGAIAAVVAVLALAVYQHVQSQIDAQRRELSELNNDLRKDLGKLGGTYSEMIKKEDHSTKLRNVWDSVKELRADRSDLTIAKERCNQLTEAHKAGEEDRRALAAEIRRLRETKTADDERAALVQEIRAIRERISQIESKPRSKVSYEGP